MDIKVAVARSKAGTQPVAPGVARHTVGSNPCLPALVLRVCLLFFGTFGYCHSGNSNRVKEGFHRVFPTPFLRKKLVCCAID